MVLLGTVLLRLAQPPDPIDDAFITFRYVENIAGGRGFVYNPGEPVLGTTTPLYTLLLALLWVVGLVDLPRVAQIVNALADGITATLVFVVGRRLLPSDGAALAASTIAACSGWSVFFALSGMETALFTTLVVGSLGACLWRRSVLAVVLAALATLTRPEGALVAGLVLGQLTVRRRRLPVAHLGLLLALLAPWLVYATWTFGHPIPHSALAKAATYHVDPLFNPVAIVYTIGTIVGGGALASLRVPLEQQVLGLGVPWVGALVAVWWQALRRAWPGGDDALPWLLFAPGLAAAYVLGGAFGTRVFPWYLAPLVPFVALLVVRGGSAACGILPSGARRLLVGALVVAMMVDLALGLNLGRDPTLHPLAPWGRPVYSWERDRVEAYLEAGAWLRTVAPEGATVATPEIGALGYASGLRVLDTVGLVSPESLRYQPVPPHLVAAERDNAVPAALIRDFRPEYVVSLESFVRLSLVEEPWFRASYRLVAAWEPVADDDRLLVFASAPLADDARPEP